MTKKKSEVTVVKPEPETHLLTNDQRERIVRSRSDTLRLQKDEDGNVLVYCRFRQRLLKDSEVISLFTPFVERAGKFPSVIPTATTS